MKNAKRQPLSLFPAGRIWPAPLDFETRLRDFARAFAARDRGREPDVRRFESALRAYHRAWTICSRVAVSELDAGAIGIAVAAYAVATGRTRKPAA